MKRKRTLAGAAVLGLALAASLVACGTDNGGDDSFYGEALSRVNGRVLRVCRLKRILRPFLAQVFHRVLAIDRGDHDLSRLVRRSPFDDH